MVAATVLIAITLAVYAIGNRFFALAAQTRLEHREQAFQASSPKTSKAGPFGGRLFFRPSANASTAAIDRRGVRGSVTEPRFDNTPRAIRNERL
jgi:hypothetical protein